MQTGAVYFALCTRPLWAIQEMICILSAINPWDRKNVLVKQKDIKGVRSLGQDFHFEETEGSPGDHCSKCWQNWQSMPHGPVILSHTLPPGFLFWDGHWHKGCWAATASGCSPARSAIWIYFSDPRVTTCTMSRDRPERPDAKDSLSQFMTVATRKGYKHANFSNNW